MPGYDTLFSQERVLGNFQCPVEAQVRAVR
jgi:hypothetical protein